MFTWCSDFWASSADCSTWRLWSSAWDSAASSVSNGSAASGGVAGPCASSVAGPAADINSSKRRGLALIRERSDAIVVCPVRSCVVGKVKRLMRPPGSRRRASGRFAANRRQASRYGRWIRLGSWPSWWIRDVAIAISRTRPTRHGKTQTLMGVARSTARSATVVGLVCRFVAYQGHPVLLADLLYRPRHSLVAQSYRAETMSQPFNGDGFGVGWYPRRCRRSRAWCAPSRPPGPARTWPA
jgi:hypothetical protein